jgi:hypothetical protein
MLNVDIQLGETGAQIKEKAGQPLEEVQLDGVTILRYTSMSDRLADYVYLIDDKATLFSFSQAQNSGASIDALFPEIGMPDKSYLYNISVDESKAYTFHFWSKKGVAAIIDGNKSDNPLLRTLIFKPGLSQEELFALWTLSENIRGETSFFSVNPITVETVQQENLLAQFTSRPYVLVGGAVIVLLIILAIIWFLWKKRTKKGPPPSTGLPASEVNAPLTQAPLPEQTPTPELTPRPTVQIESPATGTPSTGVQSPDVPPNGSAPA